MKNILEYFLILTIIKISVQIVPLWNFESAAFNLLANRDKYIYNVVNNSKLYEVTLRLEREIYRENGNINIKNTLFLNDENFGETDYDDVESFYQNNNKNYIICPKGKFHIYIYDSSKNKRIVKPNYFPDLGDWDLMCYYQNLHDVLFVAYLGNEYHFYQFNFQEESFRTNKQVYNGIYAFKWKSSGYDSYWDTKKQMFSIIKEGKEFKLYNLLFDVRKDGDINFNYINHRYLTYSKTNYTASFQKDSFNFYLISYNSVDDFEILSHSDNQEITTDNIGQINIDFLYKPLVFFEKMTIMELKFIFAMFFAYYKLKDENDKFYYGILDVPRNRVIFHTDKEILKFIPYLDYSMLAITKDSAYKICVSRNDNDCQICKDNIFMLDSSNYNFCGVHCKTKYILIPHNICTNTCDKKIFSYNDKNECGLCKDLGIGKEYKFFNQTGCLQERPVNSIDVNSELKIIDCANNYKYKNGKCLLSNCHDNCDECNYYSEDNNNQQCISCRNEKLFIEEGNCVEQCSEQYFLNMKKCIKCNESCRTCEFNKDNCLTCDETSSFKFLFKNSCYEKCPNNTIYNTKINSCEEIKKENKEEDGDSQKDEKEGKYKGNNNDIKESIMLSIFTIITAVLLFIVLFCFFRKYCCLKIQYSENLMKKINTEF